MNAGVEVPKPHKPVHITPPYSTVPSSLPADLTKTPRSVSHHCSAHLRGMETHLPKALEAPREHLLHCTSAHAAEAGVPQQLACPQPSAAPTAGLRAEVAQHCLNPRAGGWQRWERSPAQGEFAAMNGCHAWRLRFPKLALEWEALAHFAAELKG